jgi:hypothetical protein
MPVRGRRALVGPNRTKYACRDAAHHHARRDIVGDITAGAACVDERASERQSRRRTQSTERQQRTRPQIPSDWRRSASLDRLGMTWLYRGS